MQVKEILNILDHEFPNAQAELDHKNVFELLIAVTLSAQATDISVNKVTPALFEAYPNPESLAKADLKDVEKKIQSLGLFRNKAKFIIGASQMLVDDFNGEVPSDRASLMKLPGVGRKTANVVMAVGFGIPAIAVDTHVERVAKRLGWAKKDDSVLVVEEKIMKKVDPEDWARAHHLLLLLGRYHSTARSKEDIYVTLDKLKEKHGL